jgi:hypothetical protein
MNRHSAGGDGDGERKHREHVKEKQRTSKEAWKEKLRKECLEKARRKRMEALSRARQASGTTTKIHFQNGTPVRCGSSPAVVNEARSIVQESLSAGQVSIVPATPSRNSGNAAISASATKFSTPLRPTISRFAYQTPIDRHSYVESDGLFISEGEMFSLMHEVEEELQREGRNKMQI